MLETIALVLAVPILCLLSLACVSSRQANKKVDQLRRIVPWILGTQTILATFLVVACAFGSNAPLSVTCFDVSKQHGIGFGIFVDGVSSLMLFMVSLVGFVVSRFSIRYLDGEAMQGRYFRWLGLTAGAVSLMVIAGNLLMFFAAWVMTSFGLHQLLVHYRHRPAATHAAWAKFTISRLGDAFLVVALSLTFHSFGTFDLEVLLDEAKRLSSNSTIDISHTLIGWFIVLGAMTKSAQFPFHTWLPNTMETPTPVSALMHAGIVNAGGYLIVRTNPLVSLAPQAMLALVIVGAFTACFAGLVMMTQTSVKRSLAYSTIAQMGFMMLQCGLGAFSMAMLHILAHSFYKAHAFLSSGSVIAQSNATRGALDSFSKSKPAFGTLLLAMTTTLLAIAAVSLAFGVDVIGKQGGLALAFLLFLALTTWGWRLFASGRAIPRLVAVAGIAVLCVTYLGSYVAVHHLVFPAIVDGAGPAASSLIVVEVCFAFLALFWINIALVQQLRPTWLEPLRIHAANGFYVDEICRRVFGPLVNS
ncbi:proton-conducting transporter transmembrane domain-containing protein [Rhodopirellula halodulae]|uniref:proton-conducting transporter transmembrane domain-containing protein n=1 Tax=Rhodopirellula halodulae TaxID=2894198 RepID=UPI001E3ADEEE|nr:proton-conducting transporter membrane subunit [Rhodopirellula sp. JC737]MCC9654531.1 oxidoreductase [Rhodopirellula sp. JC737]